MQDKKYSVIELLLVPSLGLMLAGCAVGPDYVRPEMPVPASYKELATANDAQQGANSNWKPAAPRDAEPRGRWWEIFGDPTLNALIEKVDVSNQTLRNAEARYAQASALIRATRSSLFPTMSASASASRGASGAGTNSQGLSQRGVSNTEQATLDAQWEVDLWGRIRRSVEASQADAQATLGDLEGTRLSLQAQLAQSYFQLRVIDAQRNLLLRSLSAYQKSLDLTRNRYAAGVVTRADVAQAQTQLATTRAQAVDLGVQRAQLEHAIAVLIGLAPAEFSLPVDPRLPTSTDKAASADEVVLPGLSPPAPPAALPADLLERRPDIAAAERRVASSNAQIGVAKAAWFPSLSLGASGGYRAAGIVNLFTLPNRIWSVGPALAETLFDGGSRRALSDQAIAVYDQSVASYRQTVLTAFQDVEDNLVSIRLLEEESQAQAEAVRAARDSLQLSLNQYQAGTATYLTVITAQAAALGAERSALDVRGRQYIASANLIRALGGSWQSSPVAAGDNP